MTLFQHKQAFDHIIKLLSRDRRKKIRAITFIDMTFEARRFARKISRQIEKEEREMKRMKWKRKTTLYGFTLRYERFLLTKQNSSPLILLSKYLNQDCSDFPRAVGTFDSIQTGKYIVYLLTKK